MLKILSLNDSTHITSPAATIRPLLFESILVSMDLYSGYMRTAVMISGHCCPEP